MKSEKFLIDALGFLAIRVARLEPGWWDRRHLHGELIKIAIRAHVAHRIKMNLIQNVRMRKDLKRDRRVQREMCSIIEAVVRSYSAGRCLRLQVILHIHSMTHTETLNSQEFTSIFTRRGEETVTRTHYLADSSGTCCGSRCWADWAPAAAAVVAD